MKENKNDLGLVLIGVAVGSLISTITTLLLAPHSGEKTRKLIRKKAMEANCKVNHTVKSKRLEIEKLMKQLREALEQKRKEL